MLFISEFSAAFFSTCRDVFRYSPCCSGSSCLCFGSLFRIPSG
jgi:hypothetical protein